MSLAIDSQESGGTAHHSTTSPLTWSFNNAAGTLLIVAAVATNSSGNATITGVTYNGVAMQQVTGTPVTWGPNNGYLFFLANPATGSKIVSVAASGALDILAAAISFTGANLSNPLSTAAVNSDTSGTSNTASVAVAGTASGNYVVSVVATGSAVNSANSPTVLSAILNVSVNTAGDNIGLGEQTGGGSVTASYSVTADWWGIAAAEVFKAAGFRRSANLDGLGASGHFFADPMAT